MTLIGEGNDLNKIMLQIEMLMYGSKISIFMAKVVKSFFHPSYFGQISIIV